MTMRPLALLLAALLGVGAAGLVACGDRSELIPQPSAQRLAAALDEVQAAVASGDCEQTARALERARSALVNVPPSVDAELRARLGRGVANLERIAPRACATTTAPPTTPTDTDTTPTEPTPTEPVPTEPTPTEPVPTEPTPTEPVPTEPVPTEPVPTEPAPDAGAVAPDAETP